MGDIVQFSGKPVASKHVPDKLRLSEANNRPLMVITPDSIMKIYGRDGKELVQLNMTTGHAEIIDKERLNEAAEQFWSAVAIVCPLNK